MYFYMRSKFSLIQIGFVSNVPNQLILMKFQTMRWLLNLGKEEEVFRNMALISSHSLEKEMATHSNILAWRIPGTEEPGGLLSWDRAESDTTEAT